MHQVIVFAVAMPYALCKGFYQI